MSATEDREQEPRIARVLLDSSLPQLDHLFDYEIPEPLRGEIRIGQRVKVPFRSRQRDSLGYVIELVSESEFSGELAVISQIVSPVPMLSSQMWQLVRAVADRAGGSAADVIRLAVPNRHVRVEKSFLAHEHGVQRLLTEDAARSIEVLPEYIRARAQQLTRGERIALEVRHAPVRLDTGEWVSAWAHEIAQTALAVHASGRSVIIQVPDYRDLDQVDDTLTAFGVDVHVRLDSRQSAADRYLNFLRAHEPQPTILLGNRSTIYAPAYELGAILMWDDGDQLYSEPLSPYVHARDAALIRAQQNDAGLLFASHMHSGEVERLIGLGYVAPEQVTGPRPRIIHSGSLTHAEHIQGRIPEVATSMLRQGLEQGPVLVQVSTPGYVPVLVCGRCEDLVRCRSCRGPIGRSRSGTSSCRWCGTAHPLIPCETCGETTVKLRGAGSERTAEQFQAMFPETMILLSDGTHQRSRVDARPSVVVATRGAEPIAAGGYQAVVLLDVDRVMSAPFLRAEEQALRHWHRAAALATPAAPVVLTGGAGPALQAFITGRESAWLTQELKMRQELRFPPMVRVATITGARPLVEQAITTVDDLAGVDVLGPTFEPDGMVRATVRFSYSSGGEVASRLRAELVSQAASQSARAHTGKSRGRGAPKGSLRLRFDDPTAFDEREDDHPPPTLPGGAS